MYNYHPEFAFYCSFLRNFLYYQLMLRSMWPVVGFRPDSRWDRGHLARVEGGRPSIRP